MARYADRLLQLSSEIATSSAQVRETFQVANLAITGRLTPSGQVLWAEEGVALVRRGARHWDAATEYFRASPSMAQALTTRRLLRWGRSGRVLAGMSGGVAAAYFRASPEVVERLPLGQLDAWSGMGQNLCAAADYADTLACRFFDASPRFLQTNTWECLGVLSALLTQVAGRSLDVAVDLLNLAPRLFAELDQDDLGDFLGLGERLSQRNLSALRAYFDAGLSLYVRLNPADRASFLDLVQSLSAASPRGLATYLSEASRHLGPIVATRGVEPLILSARIAGLSTPAAREFIRNASVLTEKLTNPQLVEWCHQGEVLLASHEAAGIGYFRLQSREGLEAMTAISPAVELEEVREILRMYCQALMGKNISIVPSEQTAETGASWTSSEEVDWDGAAIFAPARLQEFASKESNFEAYKVLATHQAGHLEFGTFDFGFDRTGRILSPLRDAISLRQAHGRTFFTDYDRLFDLFVDRRLARDVFTIAEDTRIDHTLRTEYRGIRHPFRRVQEHAVIARAEITVLPLREQVIEILLRMSLEQQAVYVVPVKILDHVLLAAGLVNLLRTSPAAVEDVAEVTIRLYTILRNVANVAPADLPADVQWVTVDLGDAAYNPDAEDIEGLLEAFFKANETPEQPKMSGSNDDNEVEEQEEQPEEQDYRQPAPVLHRGDLKPELAQAMQRLQRQARKDAAGQQQDKNGLGDDEDDIPLEMLQDLVDNLDEIMAGWSTSDNDQEGLWPTMMLGNLLRNYGGQRELPKPLYQVEIPHVGDPDMQMFTYDEWDYRAKAYRPKWCNVRQRVLKEVEGTFFSEALASHRGLVASVRKQFEMLRPELLGRVKRLLDGEEFDLDAVLDARLERRAGQTPSDKVYWRRNKVERNVAVAVLLDMSLSTDERIEREAARVAREASTERARRAANKRIIDLEREGLVLLIEALEQIRDTYGIYGFSGSGREDVQFYVIKDCDEPLSERVRRRIDGIVPLQGTRMGPAIRHTISKLDRVAARTKVLIVLSDGRPQDRDYGTLPWDPEALPRSFFRPGEYGLPVFSRDALMLDEKEYAVHDTKQALNEAKAKNIIPFCISVDKQGHDYLKEMCGDIGYEVVSDIESLPRRLPSLYRRLTT